ncbi:MAG: hypothetical protein NVS4B6_11210 [Mycobacterium sp.]
MHSVDLITGAGPFTANTSLGLVEEQFNDPPPKLSRNVDWLPQAFESIMAKALAKDPNIRYDSCSDLSAVLSRALR